MRQTFLVLITLVIVFFGLSISEFYLSKKQLLTQESQPSPSIAISIYPQQTTANEALSISWQIKASLNDNTPSTSIYYGYDSTPSAVTKQDGPLALGYPLHTSDYFQGTFPIPATFDVSLSPTSAGKLYFRAYAFVKGEHLWTPEYSVIIK